MATGYYDVTSKTLGKGHYGLVKLAKHSLTGEPVAIKIIDKFRLDKDSLCQLGTEISILFKLSEYEHPNILKLYQVIDSKTKLHLVTEYCGANACDLHDHIYKRYRRNGLPEREAQHIFKQICSAIDYCHSLKIVHRDLKPENILVTDRKYIIGNQSGRLIKLIDFGFARQWNPDEKMTTSCGTLAYSAPELLLGESYDGTKVDIWGLGVMLYILLFGVNPFIRNNDNETLTRILECYFTIPQRTDASDDAIHLVKCLIRRNPNSRLLIHQIIQHRWVDTFESPPEPRSRPTLVINDDHPRLQNHYSLQHPKTRRPPTKLRLSFSSSAVAGPSSNHKNYDYSPQRLAPERQRLFAASKLQDNMSDKSSSEKITEDECSSISLPTNIRSRSFSGEDRQSLCESSSPLSNGSFSSLGRSHDSPRSNYRPTSPDIDGSSLNEEERYIHEFIVSKILALGCLSESKGSVEQSLKNAKLSNRRFFSTSIMKEISGVKVAGVKSSLSTDNFVIKNNPRARSKSLKTFKDEYVNATYQLLRDRVLKEAPKISHSYSVQSCDSFNSESIDNNRRKSAYLATDSYNSSFDVGLIRSRTERFDTRHMMGEKSYSSAVSLANSKPKQHLTRRRLLQPQHRLKDKFTSFFRGGSLTISNENELSDQFYNRTNIESNDDNMFRTIHLDHNETLLSIKSTGRNIFKYGNDKKQQPSKIGKRDQELSLCEPSRASLTHEWKILKTPNRCQECNLYVYFNGCECNVCGFVAHKRCVSVLVIRCSGQKVSARRRITTPIFGQPLKSQVIDFVKRFVQEIEARGLKLKGIYRVSSVKSKVDKLCSSYDQNAYLVDLSSFHPNIVANALKLYLRQLPEPLLTFKLYSPFIAIAKKYPAFSHLKQNTETLDGDNNNSSMNSMIIVEMRRVVDSLPHLNKEIVSIMMRHLKRVADMAQENQMTATNLSIVFGPTLLNSNDSKAFVDTVHQSRVVELLITWVDQIFPQYTTYKSTAILRLNLTEMRRQFFISSTTPPAH